MTVDYNDTTNVYFCFDAISVVIAAKITLLSASVDYLVVSLNLENKNCLIIGGGQLALEKMSQLVSAGARLSVMSESFTEAIEQYAQRHAVTLIQQPLQSQVIAKVLRTEWALVVVASERRALDVLVSRLSLACNLWVNVAADVRLSNIVLPEVVADHRQIDCQEENQTATLSSKPSLLVAIDSKSISPLSDVKWAITRLLALLSRRLAAIIAKAN